MTTYILHGGMMRFQTPENKTFYQRIVGNLNSPKILAVYFAREKQEWAEIAERDKSNLRWANPGLDFKFDIADEKDFSAQVKKSNTVALAGGDSRKLIDIIEKQDLDLKKLFEGKIVSGSSAGANLISNWYYGHNQKKVNKGLNLLPISAFTHYKPKKGTHYWLTEAKTKKIEQELTSRNPNEKIIKLHEQESIVLTSETFK